MKDIMAIKYSRTPHLKTSPGYGGDDIRLVSEVFFENENVVVMEKMDGENTSIYSNGFYHSRSTDSHGSPWQNFVAKEAARIATYNLPSNFRICGENMYAKHSIEYKDLESYFYAFNIWEDNYCLPWKDTMEWFQLLELKHPHIIYEGIFNTDKIHTEFENYSKTLNREIEGYVIRRTHGFLIASFSENLCKWVRKNHVITDTHWSKTWIPNNLG
jgi:hypothetical protein